MDYRAALTLRFEDMKHLTAGHTWSRAEFVSKDVFCFTTYDSEVDEMLASNMLEVITCILDRKTFEFQGVCDENYLTYLLMVNMPFLKNKLDWGGSIRGAWLHIREKEGFEVCCGEIQVPQDGAEAFFRDLISWVKESNTTTA